MFKIGDFSKITRVSVRMLRHYDEIGLLKPQSIDSFTGYPTRAIYHKGPWCEKDPENYLTEIQAPVVKKK